MTNFNRDSIIEAVNAVRVARIAGKRVLCEAGQISAVNLKSNETDINATANYVTGPGLTVCETYGIDPVACVKLSLYGMRKVRKLLRTLESGIVVADSYMHVVIKNALHLIRKYKIEAVDNVTQRATLSNGIVAEMRAKLKDTRDYATGTADSQTSQVRRLLIDLGLASDAGHGFAINPEHVAVKRLIEVYSAKAK